MPTQTGIETLTIGMTLAYYIQTYNGGQGGVSASPSKLFYTAPNYTAPYEGEAISLGSHTFVSNFVSIDCQVTASAAGSAANSNAQLYFFGS